MDIPETKYVKVDVLVALVSKTLNPEEVPALVSAIIEHLSHEDRQYGNGAVNSAPIRTVGPGSQRNIAILVKPLENATPG